MGGKSCAMRSNLTTPEGRNVRNLKETSECNVRITQGTSIIIIIIISIRNECRRKRGGGRGGASLGRVFFESRGISRITQPRERQTSARRVSHLRAKIVGAVIEKVRRNTLARARAPARPLLRENSCDGRPARGLEADLETRARSDAVRCYFTSRTSASERASTPLRPAPAERTYGTCLETDKILSGAISAALTNPPARITDRSRLFISEAAASKYDRDTSEGGVK